MPAKSIVALGTVESPKAQQARLRLSQAVPASKAAHNLRSAFSRNLTVSAPNTIEYGASITYACEKVSFQAIRCL